MDLDTLALKYNTDKSSDGHWYTRFYEQIFGPMRMRVESVLELGVADGASLRMWADWFPNARIFGLDMNPVEGEFGPRVVNVTVDQADEQRLLDLFTNEKLEIIIDDASHDQEKTLNSLKYLFPLLQPKGWYVIEDMDPGTFPRKFYNWMELYRSAKTIQFFMDKGDGSWIIFIQKKA